MVTDRIETLHRAKGLRLASGAELEADIVVTATGLNLLAARRRRDRRGRAGRRAARDVGLQGDDAQRRPEPGVRRRLHQRVVDAQVRLTCEYVCRLLNHMDERGYAHCTPRDRDPSVADEPLLDFSSGYVRRADRPVSKTGIEARRGGCTRTTRATSFCCSLGAIEDDAIEFSKPESRVEPVAA